MSKCHSKQRETRACTVLGHYFPDFWQQRVIVHSHLNPMVTRNSIGIHAGRESWCASLQMEHNSAACCPNCVGLQPNGRASSIAFSQMYGLAAGAKTAKFMK